MTEAVIDLRRTTTIMENTSRLFRAIVNGDLVSVRSVLDEKKIGHDHSFSKDSNNHYPLTVAALRNHVATFSLLVNHPRLTLWHDSNGGGDTSIIWDNSSPMEQLLGVLAARATFYDAQRMMSHLLASRHPLDFLANRPYLVAALIMRAGASHHVLNVTKTETRMREFIKAAADPLARHTERVHRCWDSHPREAALYLYCLILAMGTELIRPTPPPAIGDLDIHVREGGHRFYAKDCRLFKDEGAFGPCNQCVPLRARRFVAIARGLPMELQMMLCQKVFEVTGDRPFTDSEVGLGIAHLFRELEMERDGVWRPRR